MWPLLQNKTITKSDVSRVRNQSPRRISFAYTLRDQPKRSDSPYAGKFSVPFSETIKEIFEADTGIKLHPSQYGGVWVSIKTEDDFDQIVQWVKRQGTRLFLRDCLDLSVALDQNHVDPQHISEYTPLGALEARAKTHLDKQAVRGLVESYAAAIKDLPSYRDARFIAAVPPRPGKSYDLPSTLAARIAGDLGLEDLTPNFSFKGQKGVVKETEVDKKWDAWEAAGLTFRSQLQGWPAVILIDDKYQSGISIQYVASRLYDAGAGRVYGLCAVKTLRDDDNL